MLHLLNRGASSPSGRGAWDIFDGRAGATQARGNQLASHGGELRAAMGKIRIIPGRFLSVPGLAEMVVS